MLPFIFAVLTFISTMLGGLIALRSQKYVRRIMGFTAGVLLGVVAFDILPEIANITGDREFKRAMIALVVGFLFFHILEKSILLHHTHEGEYTSHSHPHVGRASALALSGHSFLDGVGIGLGFQVNNTIGIAVAIAVIAHDFTDGMNTVILMLVNNNNRRQALKMLLLDALAPVVGVISTLFFSIPDNALIIYLGFFAGFLLYIGASDILPQAHAKGSSRFTIGLTILGALFIYVVTQFA